MISLTRFLKIRRWLRHQWLEMVSNQPWVICRMFGKTGIRGQEYGEKNYAGPIVSRSEIYRCNGGRPTGNYRSAWYIKGKSGSLCWNGSQYDWCKEKYHCGGSRPISICYGKSSYYKEDRSIYYKGFHHRNAGSLKSGFAVSYFRTVGTRNPDYLVSAGASSLHEAIKLFWTFRVPWDGHTLQEQ